MKNDTAIISSVELETDPAETYCRAYGVSAAVRMGATIREGDIALLFVQGKRKGITHRYQDGIRGSGSARAMA